MDILKCMELFFLILMYILSVSCDIISENNLIEIDTNNGKIRGLKMSTVIKQNEYYSFRGIPFATPPLRELRFLPPQPLANWNGTIDTLEFQNLCVQYVKHTNITEGSEDCLYLNIYTPVIKKNTTYATMVYIHGGNFYRGNESRLLPDLLLDKNVIVATICYRLSIFGFLNLDDGIVTGNMGLKDLVLGLKWIYENIENFGGDKNLITVFGHSVGGLITNVLSISPIANKYFQRAIIQSHSAYWCGIIKNLNHIDLSREIVSKQFKENATERERILSNTTALRIYLQNLDMKTLYYGTNIIFDVPLRRRAVDAIYFPVIEDERAIDPILTDFPVNILKNNSYNLDIMMGFTDREYLYYSAEFIKNPELLTEFDKEFELDLPVNNFNSNFNSIEYKAIARDIRQFYFGDKKINNETLNEYIDLLSDISFIYGIYKITELNIQRNSGNNFLYRFAMDSLLNFYKRRYGLHDISGTGHAGEMCYLFLCDDNGLDFYKNLKNDSLEYHLLDVITDLWTNFAKYGTPSPFGKLPQWKPVTELNFEYMEISNTGIFSSNEHIKKLKFWDDLFEKHNHFTLN